MSARLDDALAARVEAGAPGALARLEAPQAGLRWAGAAGSTAREAGRSLRPDDAFRAASVTKSLTAVVVVALAGEGRLDLDAPLADLLDGGLLRRWRAFDALPRTTPRQLLSHTSGVPDYFHDPAFVRRVRERPQRRWRPTELVDHAAAHARAMFAPGEGFGYSDTGFVVAGILVEEIAGRPLHAVYRDIVLDPLGMESTWLEGHEPDRRTEVARHYAGGTDLTATTATVDWGGGGLVTTSADLVRFVQGLWAGRIVDSRGIDELTRWTAGASFPPGHQVSYERYGLGTGCLVVEGVELIGHTGFVGAFAFHAPAHAAAMAGTHNDADVDRAPLVAALCRELREHS